MTTKKTEKLFMKMDNGRTVYVWLEKTGRCIDVMTSTDEAEVNSRYEIELLSTGQLRNHRCANFRVIKKIPGDQI